jgi:hypothetical protein
MRCCPESERYMVASSGLQPIPFEMIRSVSIRAQVPSASRRYSDPSGSTSSWCRVPAQNRPARSTAPSLNRFSGRSGSGSCTGVRFPVSRSSRVNPLRSATRAPPEFRRASAPISDGRLQSFRRPVDGE